MGATAGLAAAGRLPVAFAFAVFVSMRARRADPDVDLLPTPERQAVGGYAGLSNGKDGATHQSIEDISIMRSSPKPGRPSPSDSSSQQRWRELRWSTTVPVYLRIEYEETPRIHPPDDGSASAVAWSSARAGPHARDVRDRARPGGRGGTARWPLRGIDAGVLDMASLKPLDDRSASSVARTGRLITLEDHTVIGGSRLGRCGRAVAGRGWHQPSARSASRSSSASPARTRSSAPSSAWTRQRSCVPRSNSTDRSQPGSTRWEAE